MVRPAQAKLTRERIATAAIELVEAGADLQIVPLAKKLKVSASSLYHHVSGREEIIYMMRENLVKKHFRPVAADLDWKTALREWMYAPWRMYAAHPRTLQLMLTVTIFEPEVTGAYAELYVILQRAGLPEKEILTTIEVIDGFVFGAALDALAPDKIFSGDNLPRNLAQAMAGHPEGAARNEKMFLRGVEFIIAGIESRIA